ncbi:MAG TPA: 30S ribosomal protein S8 [Candidatus Nanoarchaeia archaeon]|nr:30S ribosomal protein S8 [Candidatus Nanoarchaeia archaeon]
MMNDTLSAALSKIMNAEQVGKRECTITPTSKVLVTLLEIMNKHSFIGSFEPIQGGLRVHLLGNINNCGSIKPRFSIQVAEFEKWERRYLPARGFGIIILSTSQGMMTYDEALTKKIGGRLIAYCY